MRLSNLRLPFAAKVHCRSGRCRVIEHRRCRTLEQGACVWMPPYRLFGLEVSPWTLASEHNALHLYLSAEMSHSELEQAGAHRWSDLTDGHTRLRVAKAVFADPGASWSRQYAAGVMEIPVRSLSAKMLREGAALMEIVREQRLMRALVDMTRNDHAAGMHAGPCYGFGSLEQLQSAFFDRFGMPADRYAAVKRHCALTWSGVAL